MKILIGYDGTEAAKSAIGDLNVAGMPTEAESLVVSVAEAWDHVADVPAAADCANEGAGFIREKFPSWKVTTAIRNGCPASELLAVADGFAPDLVVIGEPMPTVGERGFFLGQNTQKLISDADCSVRVARGRAHNMNHEIRLLVGFDGSRTSLSTIDSIVARQWPARTKVRLLAVADSAVLQAIGRFTPQMTDAVIEEKLVQQWANSLARPCIANLMACGLEPDVRVRFGNPKALLPEEARSWNADAIFVGPHTSPNSFARFLIGSVSAAVAAKAPCSVEVVRANPR